MSQAAEVIRQVPLFKPFNDEIITALDVCGKELNFGEGEFLIQESSLGDEVFVILDGRVRVTCSKNPHSSESEPILLERGEILGEMAVIQNQPRSASVMAETDVVVKMWRASTLRDLCGEYPRFGYQFMHGLAKILCERLRKTNANVAVLNNVLWGKSELGGALPPEPSS